jgi:hypothetical protein
MLRDLRGVRGEASPFQSFVIFRRAKDAESKQKGKPIMKQSCSISILVALFLALSPLGTSSVRAESSKDGNWTVEQDEGTGINVYTMKLTLYPKNEPVPALKYRIIPDDFDLRDGNAAVFYLKAMGFLEQDWARKEIAKFREKKERESKSPYEACPPYSWLDMKAQELPLDEVKSFLKLTRFQCPLLREARLRRHFSVDRNIRDVDDPIAYLLPEIQAMRELARMQTLRCKVAVAENRIDDAVAILGQQYALGRHLGQDEFLVSNLVGIAITAIGWSDSLEIVQHPKAPNLYWAYASMPRPFINLRRSMALERQLLYLQFKVLREVDETPRPAGYWAEFVDRLTPQLQGFEEEFGISLGQSNDRDLTRTMLVGMIAAAYPKAKQYLIEDCGMDAKKVEAYPTTQVVFLAVVRYYDQARDDQFKWIHLPYWQAESKTGCLTFEDKMRVKPDRVGWAATPTRMLLPAVMAARTAAARLEQHLAMIQAVEAIRMYGAVHGGKLPASLDDCSVPVPPEPFTGKPLDYRCNGRRGILTGHAMPGIQYRLILRFADKTEHDSK